MTIKQVLQAVRIELNKHKAPELGLVEFNYFANKAISQYINLIYNVFETNQQTTDDIRVLKSTAKMKPEKIKHQEDYFQDTDLGEHYIDLSSAEGCTYKVQLPIDYLHLLNCICVFKTKKTWECYPAGSIMSRKATRLTADSWGMVMDDAFNYPSPYYPYFYIHNRNLYQDTAPYNPIALDDNGNLQGTDMVGKPHNPERYTVVSNGFSYQVVKITKTLLINSSSTDKESRAVELPKGKYFIQINEDPKLVYIVDSTKEQTPASQYINADLTDKLIKVNPSLTWDDFNNKLVTAEAIEIDPLEETIEAIGAATMVYPDADKTIKNLADLTSASGSSNFPRTFKMDLDGDGKKDTNVSLVERPIASRLSNPSTVNMEIRCGSDDVFELVQVKADYLKSPQRVNLTHEQMMLTQDTSQIMEYPDYVVQEIINILVRLVLENNSDQRLQSKIAVDQSIARNTNQES